MKLGIKKDPFPLDDASWPVVVISFDGKIQQVNSAANRHFLTSERKELKDLAEVWSDENGCSARVFLQRLSVASTATFPLKLQTRSGDLKPYLASICRWVRKREKVLLIQLLPRTGGQGHTGETVFFSRDAQSQSSAATPSEAPEPAEGLDRHKLMCALQLTRTVAMDFNNALTSILGHTSLLLDKLETEHPCRESLQQIEKSVERATQVALDLAAFSQEEKGLAPTTAGSTNKLLRSVVEKFKSSCASTVYWRLNFEPKLHSANFAEPKMEQAIAKIFENAIEAINGDGMVTVTSGNVEFEVDTAESRMKIPAGRYISIDINDTGPGIPAKDHEHVLEPFFTTKEGHRGLGLAWAYGLITNFGGHLVVQSATGQGTTVRIYLPASDRTEDEPPEAEAELTGDQSILIVDDEELLRTMGDMVLSSYGYKVLTAANGREALDLLEKDDTPRIDLVVTDLVMPHMDGYDLIKTLQSQMPDIRIICTSGNFRPGNSELGITYLQKPFNSMNLARAVKKVLSADVAIAARA